MDRRTFLVLTLAGAADPGPPVPPAPPSAVQAPAAPAPPPPPPTIDAAFQTWMSDYLERAITAGGPAEVLRREFAGLTPDPTVIALDGRQAEFSKPISDYIKGVVTDARVASGRAKRQSLSWLPDLEQRYGVPSQILISIWAVETAFGAIQGDMDVLRSLATLAAAGRRRGWAEGEINALIGLIASGQAVRPQLKGSWAGAMGQTQFEPDALVAYGVDADGDGRIDIWNSTEDALASTANLLARNGWRRGEPWHCEMTLRPGFDYGVAEGADLTPAAWETVGATRADGQAWSTAEEFAPAQLILPAGASGPAFLLFANDGVIRKYNNSTAYALAVGLLADRIGGAGPLKTPWPIETALSIGDRIGAQNALAKLGFDPGPPDGLIGLKTRQAIRAWQTARGLPADGYLSLSVLSRLFAETAVPPAQ